MERVAVICTDHGVNVNNSDTIALLGNPRYKRGQFSMKSAAVKRSKGVSQGILQLKSVASLRGLVAHRPPAVARLGAF